MSILYNIKKRFSRVQKKGWISSDILPTESGDYLCLTDSKYPIMNVYHYSEKHKAFNAFDSLEECETSIDVTHWQPLPEMPKEQTDIKEKLKTFGLMLADLILHVIGTGATFAACMMITLKLATHFPEWVAWLWVGVELVGGIALVLWQTHKIMEDVENDCEQ